MQNIESTNVPSNYGIDEAALTEHYEDFIGIYKGFFPPEYCNDVIKFFDFCEEFTPLVKKRNDDYVTDSNFFNTSFHHVENIELTRSIKELSDFFYKMIDFCIHRYMERYKILKGLEGFAVYDLKYQKTKPGEGFHEWHYESARRTVMTRKLVVMLYLNDVDEGGETEFLYYPKRIKSQQGKLIIWPAEFTHTHRGNSPLSGNKYIITSWVEAISG
jgi:hypothetical protein